MTKSIMDKVNKWYSKNKNRLEITILFFFVAYLGQRTLDWLFDLSIANGFQRIYELITYEVTVPVSFIFLGLLFTALVIKIWKIVKIKRSKLKIIKAQYGYGNKWVDITSELNDKVSDNNLIALISNDIAGDPVPGTLKVASVHYEIGKKKVNINVNENEILKLPKTALATSEVVSP